MAKLLVLHDFFTKDQLEAAEMFYEGGSSSCVYYHVCKLEMERDSHFVIENAAYIHLYEIE
ncbi:hypothetical protein [Domibacillus tundrae]|uniref:hypothetical protein n=1 Tax=Domibacillus tundrae TaxID=1587527 RepID=UPI003393DC84